MKKEIKILKKRQSQIQIEINKNFREADSLIKEIQSDIKTARLVLHRFKDILPYDLRNKIVSENLKTQRQLEEDASRIRKDMRVLFQEDEEIKSKIAKRNTMLSLYRL